MTRSLALLPLGPAEEEVLLKGLREGQSEAFEALYQRFVGQVLRQAMSLLRDQAAAEDAVQESFLRVFRSIRRFHGRARLGTWIYRITTNVCFTELERRKKRTEHAAPDQLGSTAGQDASTMDLERMLWSLEPVKRVTFYLHHVEGLSAREVAEVLDDSRDAVLKRLQRTRLELVELLRGEDVNQAARTSR